MKLIISIIIPCYNSENTLDDCLKAVYSSSYKNFEVILIDDGSTDSSISIAKNYPVKIIRLKQRSGPARVRNVGVEHAKGEIIVFIDSDVIIEQESLNKIVDDFRKNDYIVAVNGLYSKTPANKGLFPSYLALQKYYNFSRSGKYFSHLATAFCAIKKNIFVKHKGFNPKNKEMEDYELGFRITRRDKILLDKRLKCKHFFPSFTRCAKKYFIRTQYWLDLFLKHKRFSTGIATKIRGFSSISSLLSLVFLLLFIFYFEALYLLIPFFLFSFYADRGFFRFVYSKKSFIFMIYSMFVSYSLQSVVGVSFMLYFILKPFKILLGKRV